MATRIPVSLGRKLIADPVMAAKVLMSADLDVFQRARLRLWWFVPSMLDHSGVSTAKTETLFIWAFLRCMLLTNPPGMDPRMISIYYQALQVAREVFLKRVTRYAHASGFFLNQIKLQRGKALWTDDDGGITIEGRAGWQIQLPAGNFAQDSKNQASKRFNDLVIEEAGEVEKLGRGVSKQLVQRNTAASFNPDHPIWCNHTKFLGHAESEEHPFHKRYKRLRSQIEKRGSTFHATFTSNYRDYRGEFWRKYGLVAERAAREQKLSELSPEEFDQIWNGLWRQNSKTWFGEAIRKHIRRREVVPHLERRSPEAIYAFGGDFAGGMTEGADSNAGAITCAVEVDPAAGLGNLPMEDPRRLGLYEIDGRLWEISVVYGYLFRGMSTDVVSGIIHRAHLRFNFSVITLDGQGGGSWVYKKLVEREQVIDNRRVTLDHGLCRPVDHRLHPEAEPIISLFGREDLELRAFLGDRFLLDNSGPLEFANTTVRGLMARGDMGFPVPVRQLDSHTLDVLDPRAREQYEILDKFVKQFGNIAQKTSGPDKTAEMSSNGYRRFVKLGKTDGAMSVIYSLTGLLRRLRGKKQERQAGQAAGFYS